MAGSRPEGGPGAQTDGVRWDRWAVLPYPVAFPPALIPHTIPERIVFACWAIFLVVWFVAAFRTKRTVERSGAWWWRIIAIVVVASFITRRRTAADALFIGAKLWSTTGAMGVIAVVLVVLGLALALWARAILGGNWSATVTFKAGHELIERGPYRYVRHPIYSAILLMLLGTALLSGRIIWLVAVVLAFIGFWIKSRAEERLLTRHFPEAYPAYRARVKALVPFVL